MNKIKVCINHEEVQLAEGDKILLSLTGNGENSLVWIMAQIVEPKQNIIKQEIIVEDLDLRD